MNIQNKSTFRAATLVAAFVTILCLSACQPIFNPVARFSACRIVFFDTTVAPGRPTRMQAAFDEVSAFTGISFVQGTYAQAQNDEMGLLITSLPSSAKPLLAGWTILRWYYDLHGARVIVHGEIQLRSNASQAIMRHELGHLFNLSHNDGSRLMRPAPMRGADYAATERAMMRDTVRRARCDRSSAGPAPVRLMVSAAG